MPIVQYRDITAGPVGSRRASSSGVTSDTIKQTNLLNQLISVNKNSNYRDSIARRVNAAMPYSRTRLELNTLPCTTNTVGPLKTDWNTCTTYSRAGVSHGLTASRPDIDEIALRILKNKIQAHQKEFEALVPLGELKETRNLIRSAVGKTTNLIVSVIQLKKHFKTKRYRAHLRKTLADAWLTYAFGISPTLNDIDNGIASIHAALHNTSRENLRFKGVMATDWKSASSPVSVTAATGSNVSSGPLRTDHLYICKYVAGLKCNVASANSYNMRRHLGFDLPSAVSAGWELIPFSWVIDYFTTAGDFFSDIFYTPPGVLIYLTKTTVYDYTQRAEFGKAYALNPAYKAFGGRGGVNLNVVKINRTLGAELPHIGFRLKSVDEIGFHSLTKLLNLVSVAAK